MATKKKATKSTKPNKETKGKDMPKPEIKPTEEYDKKEAIKVFGMLDRLQNKHAKDMPRLAEYLYRIKSGKLYLYRDHKNFESFVNKEINIKKSKAYTYCDIYEYLVERQGMPVSVFTKPYNVLCEILRAVKKSIDGYKTKEEIETKLKRAEKHKTGKDAVVEIRKDIDPDYNPEAKKPRNSASSGRTTETFEVHYPKDSVWVHRLKRIVDGYGSKGEALQAMIEAWYAQRQTAMPNGPAKRVEPGDKTGGRNKGKSKVPAKDVKETKVTKLAKAA